MRTPKKSSETIRREHFARRRKERRMAKEHNWAADEENLSEMAWASPGDAWETEADNTNGSHIYEVLANDLVGVQKWWYVRRITFKLDNDKLYQFEARLGHDGDHEYGEPYPAEAYTETVTKYRKQ